MAETDQDKFATEVAGKAESGYAKILAVDDEGRLKIKDIFRGMAFLGDVTAVTDTTNFTVGALTGKGDDFFVDYEAHIVRDAGGAGAAPQGEHQTVSDYVSTSGLFTIDKAYTAAIAVGDTVLFIHQQFGLTYDRLVALQGGPYTIADIMAILQAELDLAEVKTLASPVTLTGSYQYVFSETSDHPFYFAGGFFRQATGAWAGGESVTIDVEAKNDGTNWDMVWEKTYAAAPDPVSVAVPSAEPAADLTNIPMGFYNNGGGVRVGIKQTVEGAGYGTWDHSFIRGKRGG